MLRFNGFGILTGMQNISGKRHSVRRDLGSVFAWREREEGKCQHAIYGRITKTEYLIHHDTPWTKLEIACQENFKGGIEKGQQISVYVLGGYLDKHSYEKKFDDVAPIDDDGLVEMKYFQNELSKVGDEGVFYLVSDREEDIFEKDAYFLLCSGYSKMMYDKKTGDIKETAHESVKKVPRGQFFSKIRAHVKQKK